MVQDTLCKDRKPVLKTVTCYDTRLNQWFRPSGGSSAVFDPDRNAWSGLAPYQIRTGEWTGSAFVPYPADSFANVVIYDSLPFVLIDREKGIYRFERPLQNQFWWIDNRGFGNNSIHNEYFTMEIHMTFKYAGGETFRFEGDDDVWVFINGKLAQDLGGMNAQSTKTVYVDQKASELGIQVGGTCRFDFFYCERSGKQSTATVATDIFAHSVNPDSVDAVFHQNKKMVDNLPFFDIQGTGRNNPSKRISLYLAHPEQVKVRVNSIDGKEGANLASGWMEKGRHDFTWNTRNLTSGCYFIRMQSATRSLVRSFPVIR